MTNPSDSASAGGKNGGFRRLTKDEILDIANRIRFEDQLDLDVIREGVTQLFGERAHKATLVFDSHYNDEGYSARPSEIKVWDANGRRLKGVAQPEGETPFEDALYDLFSDVEISDTGEDCSMGDVTVFIKAVGGLELEDLYVAVPATQGGAS